MRNTYLRVERLISGAIVAVLSLFDRGIDGAIAEFIQIETKLGRHIARQQMIYDLAGDQMNASLRRETEVREAEKAFRTTMIERRRQAISAEQRAERVRDRIAKLLD